MDNSYDSGLVLLSIAISVFASFTALSIADRYRQAPTPAARAVWLAAAAIAMGGGIWSMHFVAMLAFELGIPVAYDLWLTLFSLVLAVLFTAIGFGIVGARGSRADALALGGLFMGGGVATMHYTGMAAMRMAAAISYDLPLVAVSVLIAVTASIVALWLSFNLRTLPAKIGSAMIMGAAVCGMHYTGMAAAHYASHLGHVGDLENSVPPTLLGIGIGATSFIVLFLALVSAIVDQRFATRASEEAERLRNSERRFRSLVQNAADAIAVIDQGGRMSYESSSTQRVLGYGPGYLLGRPLLELVHPDDAAALASFLSRVAAKPGAIASRDARLRQADGRYGDFEIAASNQIDEPSVGGVVVNIRDISARRENERLQRAKEAAEIANLSKSQFLANMSHELRTPLNAVIGYSEMLLEDLEHTGTEQQTSDLGKIRSAGKHLLALINDVLDLSKIEAGKMELHNETFEVRSFVEDVAATCQALAEKNRNRLVVSCADGLGSMVADVTKLRQTLFNLISNAAKFTAGGKIELTAARGRENGTELLHLTVRDTGIGMSPEQIGRLFQNFTQADAATSAKYGGTGLGLALSQRLINLMGGLITVESALGSGSCFTLSLPVEPALGADAAVADAAVADPAVADVASADSALGASIGSGIPILVIDDDPSVRDMMQRILQREGFAPYVATGVEAGLALARQVRPAAIVLDVLMPSIDGWEALRRLKADPALASCPVVMLTMVDDRRMGFALGAADYLVKPVDRDQLLKTLDRFRSGGSGHTVLVVDDDADARELASRALGGDGWTVLTAADCAAAREALLHGKPDVLILDLVMPGMNGIEFLHQLCADAAWANLPVVVLTGKQLTAEDRAALAPAQAVLAKAECGPACLVRELRKLIVTAETVSR